MSARVEETLLALVERFNRHADQHPALRQELDGLTRTIQISLSDGPTYALELKDGKLGNLRSTALGKADVTISTDLETFEGLLTKEIGPMKALVTRRLRLEGSLEDKLLFRKLL